jgi:hypothetical protein
MIGVYPHTGEMLAQDGNRLFDGNAVRGPDAVNVGIDGIETHPLDHCDAELRHLGQEISRRFDNQDLARPNRGVVQRVGRGHRDREKAGSHQQAHRDSAIAADRCTATNAAAKANKPACKTSNQEIHRQISEKSISKLYKIHYFLLRKF